MYDSLILICDPSTIGPGNPPAEPLVIVIVL